MTDTTRICLVFCSISFLLGLVVGIGIGFKIYTYEMKRLFKERLHDYEEVEKRCQEAKATNDNSNHW